eukprot:3060732-Karenia_brevis.AAC.1
MVWFNLYRGSLVPAAMPHMSAVVPSFSPSLATYSPLALPPKVPQPKQESWHWPLAAALGLATASM